MNFILFDDNNWENLLPLTFTKPVGELRIGILTIKEKWEKYLNTETSYLTREYLQEKFYVKKENDNLLINCSALPNKDLVKKIQRLNFNQALTDNNNSIIAVRLSAEKLENFIVEKINEYDCVKEETTHNRIINVWDIISLNSQEIIADFNLITTNKTSSILSKTNTLLGNNIFIGKNCKIECATLNTTTGPIYIGNNVEIMEGAVLRGPIALCDNTTIKIGAKIYNDTTIGPYCKIGGEVINLVMQAYSNKGHDGFIGNSVIGEWCNIGADTNSSNLKNNYEKVKLWNYKEKAFITTGLQFCGLIMGDHSKCSINSMFNTGTVIGVSSNIFGTGFVRNFVPSFSWGGYQGFTNYKLEKAIKTAELVMKRRNIEMLQADKNILKQIFESTKKYRNK